MKILKKISANETKYLETNYTKLMENQRRGILGIYISISVHVDTSQTVM